MNPRNWKPSLVASVLVLAAALFGAPQDAAAAGPEPPPASSQEDSAAEEVPTLEEVLVAARAALAEAVMLPRHSLGLTGGIQGDSGARFGLDANAAVEYRRLLTRNLSVCLALPADVTADRRAFRLIFEDPDVSLGLRLFVVRVGRLVVVGGVGAGYGFRLGDERNPVRVEGALSFPIPTRPRWAIDVSLGRQFRSGGDGDSSRRYATLGVSRAF